MSEKPEGHVIPSAADMDRNLQGVRTATSDAVQGDGPAMRDGDDPSRTVIQQDTPQPQQIFDEHKTRMSPSERAKRKAMLVQAYDRGIIHDRLKVDLPAHIHGEWVRNDPMEIDRLRSVGFEIDREFAVRRSIHSDGGDAAIVGDVIHMIAPKEIKELIDEVRMDKFIAINGKPGDKKAKTKEEREFESNTLRDSGGDVPVITESTTTTRFSKGDVAAALERIDNQTRTQVPST